jgi:hypothetical protein
MLPRMLPARKKVLLGPTTNFWVSGHQSITEQSLPFFS